MEQHETLSLGEYLRRLRRERKWTLQHLADKSGISYSHLSRIENDSAVPNPKTIAVLAGVLDADVAVLLQKADNLPPEILKRLEARGPHTALNRAASGRTVAAPPADPLIAQAEVLARAAAVPDGELALASDAVVRLLRLDSGQRAAISHMIKSYLVEPTPDDE